MDLDLLPTFLVFAECKSFTEAGRRLGLTQPAVHGQVRRLAEQVGDPLYHRVGRNLALTPRGERTAALAREVLGARDAFLGQAQAPVLAAGRGAWEHVLLPRHGPWLKQHGVIPVVASGDEALQRVRDGRADLGVGLDAGELDAMVLDEVGEQVLVPPDWPVPRRLEDLDDRPWVMPSPGRPHRNAVEARLREAGLRYRVAATCDDWSIAAAFVGLGVGAAVVNGFVTHAGVGVMPLAGRRHGYRLFWRHDRARALAEQLRSPG